MYQKRSIVLSMHGKAVIARLRAEGWSLVRISGSHHIMAKGRAKVPVPVHGAKDIKPGTLANIARQTSVKFN